MTIIDLLIILLVVWWIGGLALHIGGMFIHLIIVIAALAFIYRLVTSRK